MFSSCEIVMLPLSRMVFSIHRPLASKLEIATCVPTNSAIISASWIWALQIHDRDCQMFEQRCSKYLSWNRTPLPIGDYRGCDAIAVQPANRRTVGVQIA
jgi:hypothetical protein